MKPSLISPYTSAVIIAAILVTAWVSTRPGDHTTIYTIIGGFVGLYLKNAYDAAQAEESRQQVHASVSDVAVKQEVLAQKTEEAVYQIALVDGKIVEVGKNLDGRLTELLASEKKSEYLRGHDEGRKEESREGLIRGGVAAAPQEPAKEKEMEPIPVKIVADTPVPVTETPKP